MIYFGGNKRKAHSVNHACLKMKNGDCCKVKL